MGKLCNVFVGGDELKSGFTNFPKPDKFIEKPKPICGGDVN